MLYFPCRPFGKSAAHQWPPGPQSNDRWPYPQPTRGHSLGYNKAAMDWRLAGGTAPFGPTVSPPFLCRDSHGVALGHLFDSHGAQERDEAAQSSNWNTARLTSDSSGSNNIWPRDRSVQTPSRGLLAFFTATSTRKRNPVSRNRGPRPAGPDGGIGSVARRFLDGVQAIIQRDAKPRRIQDA